jgi:hypothetical protein
MKVQEKILKGLTLIHMEHLCSKSMIMLLLAMTLFSWFVMLNGRAATGGLLPQYVKETYTTTYVLAALTIVGVFVMCLKNLRERCFGMALLTLLVGIFQSIFLSEIPRPDVAFP